MHFRHGCTCSIVALLTIAIQSFPAESQWSRRNPIPAGTALNGVYFRDSLRAWFVGLEGTLVSTTDGGQTWSESLLRPQAALQRIVFTDELHGVIVGGDDGAMNGAIFVTTDGGRTWIDRYNDPMRYALFDVCFQGSDTGWTSGFLGILKTTDGGMTWTKNSSPGLGWNTSVYFINDTLGWATNPNGGIFKTTNAGSTWTQVANLGFRWLRRIRFATPQIGWAVGGGLYEDRGIILRTTDGGTSWTFQDSSNGLKWNDVFVLDSLNAWVAGTRGMVYSTTDGGTTWLYEGTNESDDFNQITFVNGKPWIVGGTWPYASILTRGPIGFRWIAKSSRVTLETLRGVAFNDANNGWIGGDKGTLLHTTDRGDHWSVLDLFSIDLHALSAPAPGHLYIGGVNGTLLKTTDDGRTWTVSQIPGMYDIAQLQFVDTEVGWVSGEYYPFMKTTDAGRTWNAVPISSWIASSRFVFVDRDNGWVLGAQPIIDGLSSKPNTSSPGQSTDLYHTTDGGATWEDTTLHLGIIVDITFSDVQHGWLLSHDGKVFGTADAGASWDSLWSFGWLTPLSRLVFTSDLQGWAVVDDALYSTQDGGRTFEFSRYIDLFPVEDLYFHSSGLGFAVGGNGTIFRYLNPTVSVHDDGPPVAGLPSGFNLEQNYPNPFNPRTIIGSQLPAAGHVKMAVYDILGREVAVLVNERRAAGYYQDSFDGSGLASGVYLCRLASGSHVQTRKMILAR